MSRDMLCVVGVSYALPVHFRITLLTHGKSYDCLSVSETTLKKASAYMPLLIILSFGPSRAGLRNQPTALDTKP